MRKTNGKANGKDTKPQFVRLLEGFQLTQAWRQSSPVERCLYIEIKRRFNGTNNGRLSMAVREAARLLNVCPNTALKAFRGLLDKGFIKPASKGSFDLKSAKATRWILTEENYIGLPPTEDFTAWESPPKIQNTVARGDTVGSTR